MKKRFVWVLLILLSSISRLSAYDYVVSCPKRGEPCFPGLCPNRADHAREAAAEEDDDDDDDDDDE